MSFNFSSKPFRTIRSFVLREGRFTKAQRQAYQTLLPLYGIPTGAGVVSWNSLFGFSDSIVLEIGFGQGDSLITMAQQEPKTNFVGIEVYKPGIGNLLKAIHNLQLKNIRIFYGDAKEILASNISNHSLDRIQIFFPDPWPKRRHHKRRLIQTNFIQLIFQKLKTGGIFHLATDWEDYAKSMLKTIESVSDFKNLAGEHQFAPRLEWRPQTKFEKQGKKAGRPVFDLMFVAKN